MSDITVRCARCERRHGLESYNARLIGPVLHVECPFCRKKTVQNLTKFVENQIPMHNRIGRYELFHMMLKMCKNIKEELG